MNILRWLLFPMAIIYSWVSRFRNNMYNNGNYPSTSFEIPLISVGNLTVGGTGKTPHIEYIYRLLSKKAMVAILSRGYGRKTRGFRLASEKETAATIGDEPAQYFHKFSPDAVVAVGEQRILAVPEILVRHPETDVILLDDAFQHRKINPSLNILLSDFNRPFYQDFLLPTGDLRDNRSSANRANLILVTKCPEALSEEEKREITTSIQKYSKPQIPILFTKIKYASPLSLKGSFSKKKPVLLVSGLANPTPFDEFCRKNFDVKGHIKFKDHHFYSKKDVQMINELAFASQAQILMTEKDAVKWKEWITILSEEVEAFYLPIEVEFLSEKDEKTFQERLEREIEERKGL